MPMPLITPNLHVILIHFPLAFLTAGTFIELFGFLWPRTGFRLAGRWMILIGALAGLPAVYSGIYAMRDVARADGDIHWYDLKGSPTRPGQSPVFSDPAVWHLLRSHLLIQLTATLVCVAVVVVWLGSSDRLRRISHWPLMTLLLAAVGATGVGAWFGGELIYRQGVSVEKVCPRPQADPPPTEIEGMFPVMELHIVAAGVVTALAAASIGLSFRRINGTYDLVQHRPATSTTAPAPSTATATDVAMARSLNHGVAVEVRPAIPAARFWLLTLLLAIGTAVGGLFIVARDFDVFAAAKKQGGPNGIPKLVWEAIFNKPQTLPPNFEDLSTWPKTRACATALKVNRRLAHTATGSAIVLLPILLAALVRFAPRQRIALAITTALLLAAIALQVWLGALMLFDTTDGTITRLNPAAAAARS